MLLLIPLILSLFTANNFIFPNLKSFLNFISENQEGAGDAQDDSKLYHIASLVANKIIQSVGIDQRVPQSSNYPTTLWQSSSLLPPVAEAEKDVQSPEITYPSVLKKDDLNDNFDEKQLLNLIPKARRHSAKILLEQFDNRGNELTWNSSGTLFIDQVAIPNSNIFILFPFLFKATKPKTLIGLQDLVQKILDMGLGDFIVTKLKKKVQNEITPITPVNKNNEADNVPWWYIGD